MKSLASEAVLQETRARLLSVAADDRARWGKMSATQMMRHPGCAYEVAPGERTVMTVKGAPPAVMMGAVAKGNHRQPSHPMFGPMTSKDWMRRGYLHTGHHLRQFGR